MVASPVPSVQPSAKADVGWLRRHLNLNFFLGLFSLGTCALLWQFARPLGIPLLSNLPPITEVVTPRLRASRVVRPKASATFERHNTRFEAAMTSRRSARWPRWLTCSLSPRAPISASTPKCARAGPAPPARTPWTGMPAAPAAPR